uniref:calsyntenin-3-like n=1 Tax=Pristiophorus japonicus TaxID=55135 RepID=UPI00398F5198
MHQQTCSVFVSLLITACVSSKANKHKPWIEAEYQGIVMENDKTVLLNPPLFAIDKDAPLHYAGEICGFKIHGQNVPFEAVVLDKMTGEGLIRAKEVVDCEAQKEHTFTIQAHDCNIRNTEKLDIKNKRLYTFAVTAYDCGKKRSSEDAQVEVEVKPTCRPAWLGWNKRIEYIPGTGAQPLFPHIHLETCDEAVWNIQASVELQTNHVAKGCDRDNYSEKTLRKLCGAIPGELDLLPPPSELTNWTSGLSTYYSQDTSQIYWFNGSQSVRVPDTVLREGLSDHFTLSFWLRHGAISTRPHKEEEAVVCNTMRADEGFAHYALTIHGCRAIFLYWPQLENARPVKFLWKLEQVCDDEWHHYALNLQFPAVTLYVDGVTYDPALIHDSGLLRPPKPEARLIIAACWQDVVQKETNNVTESSQVPMMRLDRFLQGFLAGFTVRPGSLESREVLECLYACKEGLDFSDFESLGKGMKVHINPSQTLLTLEGDDLESLNRAIEHVTYRNTLRFATPGVRPLKLTTSVKCFSEEACVAIPAVDGYVVVLQPDVPRIALSGAQHLARPAGDFESPPGVQLFPELRITCSITHDVDPRAPADGQSAVQDSLISDEIIHSLDSCEVFVVGDELQAERESLLLDQTLVRQKGLQVSNTSSIVTISGVENIAVYELILRGIRYHVRPGATLYERRFRLVCAEMNGRYISNEFSVE